MKRCGRTAQSPLYLSLSVLNIHTQNRLQVNAQTKKMNQKILLERRRERWRESGRDQDQAAVFCFPKMEGWREKRGGGWWLQIKDTPEMGRCRECSSAERDASRLWLADCVCVCVCVCVSQYRNARQHALPSSLQLYSARSFKANRKQSIDLLLCFISMRQNDYTHVFTS